MKTTAILTGLIALTMAAKAQQTNTSPWPSTGNVSLGGYPTTPANHLDIVTSGLSDNLGVGGSCPAIRLFGGTSCPAQVPTSFTNPYAKIGLSTIGNTFIQNAVAGDLCIQNVTQSNAIIFSSSYSGSNGIEQMRLTNAGQLGIGTSAPTAKLHVYDPVSAQILAMNPSYKSAKLSLANNWLTYFFSSDSAMGRLGVTGPNPNYPSSGPQNLDFALLNMRQTAGAPQVWVGYEKPQGTNSDFNFAVAGKMVAKIIYVTASGPSNWADYVFASDYKLPKLAEVEKFYKANKHLSEVPTAAEVAEKGINVAEINTVLVKKVEELTLYMVDLNKKVEALMLENEKLKSAK